LLTRSFRFIFKYSFVFQKRFFGKVDQAMAYFHFVSEPSEYKYEIFEKHMEFAYIII